MRATAQASTQQGTSLLVWERRRERQGAQVPNPALLSQKHQNQPHIRTYITGNSKTLDMISGSEHQSVIKDTRHVPKSNYHTAT